MPIRDIYLKIEQIPDYSPVDPDPHVIPPKRYRRDCMRNHGHEDGTIPLMEVNARRLTALVYREYLDPNYLIPKPDKLVLADVNEPVFGHHIPGTVIYAHPGDHLLIHVMNADMMPHSLHLHGLDYGIDSAGAWPFGTQSPDGRRSDEICLGQSWTYRFDITDEMVGAWPFHDHYHHIAESVNRGLFGGIIVLPRDEPIPAAIPLPTIVQKFVTEGALPVDLPGIEPPDDEVGIRSRLPFDVAAGLVALEELMHAPQIHQIPDPPAVLHVPLFFHFMNGPRAAPAFDSGTLVNGQQFTQLFSSAGTYEYFCKIHGQTMSGTVRVQLGAQAQANVSISDNQFIPAEVSIRPGGRVIWTHISNNPHTVTEKGTTSLPTFCLNGRAFVGNTPTILATAGQKIRWYVFNLHLDMAWHNFHPHAQRWQFAHEVIDVRSLGPADSFIVETTAPPVVLLPPEIREAQEPHRRPADAIEHRVHGDFLFHCHTEMHMMEGMVGLVRSRQTIWLTPQQYQNRIVNRGIPQDWGDDNTCPTVDLERCVSSQIGRWAVQPGERTEGGPAVSVLRGVDMEELPGNPAVTMMHAVLLPRTTKVLFWGYGQRPDHSRLWDHTNPHVDSYELPANQPIDVAADENIWSGSHAILHTSNADGILLVHGGFATGPNVTANTERLSFYFNPVSRRWRPTQPGATGLTAERRFYPTTLTLADGRALTLFGQDTSTGNPSRSIEVFEPATGTWEAPIPLPASFNYLFYPWTFLLPGGDLFIAGPQVPTRRFTWTATPIVDDLNKRWNTNVGDRGTISGGNMSGTAVLLPLRPPNYRPRVMILGGDGPTAATVEMINLSAANPAWRMLPTMNRRRDRLNAVLLPDGRVFVAGGRPGGGPSEILNPANVSNGWQLGPRMKYERTYHSAAILLPDGSVLMGGDPMGPGGPTPHERYLPSYFFKPRPVIAGAPVSSTYGADIIIQTPVPSLIEEAILIRPGAVTHGFNMSQRIVGCVILGRDATSIRAQAPPDGTVAPPGYYLLFIVDRDRIPSLGSWIRLMA
jgi:plastocyanin